MISFLGAIASAQPMSGTFTVGGTSPSFATLQDAANAVKSRGVSEPVFFNIRPGTYIRDDGASPVLVIDSVIAGVSPTNRVTFQPDAASGGNVGNVILQIRHNAVNGTRILSKVKADYITLRNLTFEDADTARESGVNSSLVDASFDNSNATIEGLVVEGCAFVGNAFIGPGEEGFGTAGGIVALQNLTSATIRNNRFYRLLTGISNQNNAARSDGPMIVEDNQFLQGYLYFSGSGNPLGGAILLASANVSVKRNLIDFAGGNGGNLGIDVAFPASAVIEGNLIKNHHPWRGGSNTFTGIRVRNEGIPVDSIVIVNNYVVDNNATSQTGIWVQAPNTKVLHNTIVNYVGGGNGLVLHAAHCTVLNNIILEGGSGFVTTYDQGSSTESQGLVSNHNILYRDPTSGGIGLIFRNGVFYASISTYQSSTGLDTNSFSKIIDFVFDSLVVRLDACQSQDPDLLGIPIPSVERDYFGRPRNPVRPFKGAEEGVRLPYDMFAAPFKVGSLGSPLSLAAGKFDNPTADGIAVPDANSNHVLLFHNQPGSRSFVHAATLSPGFSPYAVKFFDLDRDGHLDLIVGVRVYWGDGAGGFPADTLIQTAGRIRSIDTGRVSFFNLRTIILAEDDGVLPSVSFLGWIENGNGRHLSHHLVIRPISGGGSVPDSIRNVIHDFVAGDFDGNGSEEIAAIVATPLPPPLLMFKDTTLGNCPWGHHDARQFGTGPLSSGSNIVIGDFDGDGDRDLITTGASDNHCMFLRNQGNLSFSVDTISTWATNGLVTLDYENDGDLDFVATNSPLQRFGITVFLNDGMGHFTEKTNCYFPFASGIPRGIVAADFDLDGKTDIAFIAPDSLFVLYNLGGFNGTTAVRPLRTDENPQTFTLFQNYPNPFNPSTRIEYALPVESSVTIKVYNILGQEVATLVNEQQLGGQHIVEWNGRSSNGLAMSSGVYFYRVEARPLGGQPSFTSVKKMVLVK
jgi:hypothetical protein